MNPAKKESAFLHLPTYTADILYHLGSFVSVLILILNLLIPITTGSGFWLLSTFLFVSGICGLAILIKRIGKPSLRSLSNPDDYLSNLLVTLFQLSTALSLLLPTVRPVYFIVSAILFFWFPFGKLRHAIYFFAARYHLGLFFGRRGVWPPKSR
jgi:nitrate reductase gamma subunit